VKDGSGALYGLSRRARHKSGNEQPDPKFYGGTRSKQPKYFCFHDLESLDIQYARFEAKKLGWLAKIL
jgi:hypothetical protein